MSGRLSEHPKTMMVLHRGGAKVDYGGLNYYVRIFWDATPPDHYDRTWVTCAVLHNSRSALRYLMILKDHGTHYERIGLALPTRPFYRDVVEVAGFDELASTTNGLPTLCPSETSFFYWWCHDLYAKDLDWLQDTREITITLG
jgi:hypothetical protein